MGETISLKVKEIIGIKDGQFNFYISPEDKAKLNFSDGDIGSLVKTAKGVGICKESKKVEEGMIGLNPVIRKNCGAKINDHVDLKKIEPLVAKKITMKPYKLNLTLRKYFIKLLKRFLKGNPVSINNLIKFSKDISREIALVIVDIEPLGFCIVGSKTKIEVDTDISGKFETI